MRITLWLILACLMPVATVLAQDAPRKATVVTMKGDTVEGVLRGMTETEVTLEIAGQPMKIPVESVRYVSFAGKIDAASPSSSTSAPGGLDAALIGFRELNTATAIGVLRSQYSDKLVATMTPVRAFVDKDPTEWSDVKRAMRTAMASYQEPLSTVEAWKNASIDFASGARWSGYAQQLATNPNERTHREEPTPRTLTLGQQVEGRLGFGDTPLPKDLLGNVFDGGSTDQFTFELPSQTNIEIVMSCAPCRPGIVLLDPAGKKIDGNNPFTTIGTADMKKRLAAGKYTLLATTELTHVGVYKLIVR